MVKSFIFFFMSLFMGLYYPSSGKKHIFFSSGIKLTIEEIRSRYGGISYKYSIKNLRADTLAAESYLPEFKVNDKIISFDSATLPLPPGKSVSYSPPETFYSKDYQKLHYFLKVRIKNPVYKEIIAEGFSYY